jgi:hypothetical protein
VVKSQSLCNLLYTNQNPKPETICIMCEPWIGFVFDPEYALPLPAHPGCYCTYYPSSEPVTEWKWADMPQATRWRWVLYTAWLLRIATLVPDALRSLIPDAEEENERREDEEQGPAPPGPKPPKEGSAMSDLTTDTRDRRAASVTNERVRLAAGRVHLSAQAGLVASRDRRYDVTLMKAGINLNGWDMPAEVLAAALSKFSGAACLVDHAGWDWPELEKLAGTHEAAVFTGDAVTASLRLNGTNAGRLVAQIFDAWLEDKEAGRPVAPVGLSSDLSIRWEPRDNWDEPRVAAEVIKVWSVDAVLHPAAGGRVERVLNSIGGVSPQGGNRMDEERILDQTPEGGAGDDGQAPMTEQREARIMAAMEALQQQVTDLMPEPEPEPDPVTIQLGQLTDLVTGLQEHVARQEEDRVVQGMGVAPRRSSVSLGRNSLEQVQVAVEALIAGVAPPGDVRPLSGIRELYTMLSGDYGLTGVFDAERVWLANVTSATMAGLCADALKDFSSLHDAKWITLGGVGELPTVAEGAAYVEMTWDDNKETSSFIKKGGYLGLTIEAIDKDDVNKLRSAPRALAQAAYLTMSKSISALFTANAGVGPAMADGVKVFNAAHLNLGTTALSWASWVATRTAMRQQTELNSGERLGALTAGYYLLVPSDLEILALQIIGSSGEPGTTDNDINPIPEAGSEEARRAEARKRVIVVDLWTDANDWAAVAKPQLYPSIGLGFRFGRTPEIFSVASPTAGLMFSNDTMPIKVRFFFAVGVTNHRGLYKHNVA